LKLVKHMYIVDHQQSAGTSPSYVGNSVLDIQLTEVNIFVTS